MAKRIKTGYVGVYYTLVSPPGGKRTDPYEGKEKNGKKKEEKCFLVTFKRHGERKQHEEALGRESQGWSAAKANNRRSELIGGALTKKETAEEALRKQKEAELEKENNKHLYCTVHQAMEAYLEHLDSASKKQDESRYRLHIKPHCANKPVSKLEPLDLVKISTTVKENGLKPQTTKHVLALLRRAIKWAKKNKLCVIPDDLEFKMPKFNNVVTHEHYAEEELAALLAKLEEIEFECPVGSGFLQCAIYTGLRPIQIRYLKWTDIDYNRDNITVREKGIEQDGKAIIPLSEDAKNLFKRLPKVDDYVFPSSRGGLLGDYRYQIHKALDIIKLPSDFRPVYSLRHNFATWFASLEGTDIYMLRDLMTHKDIRTTQRYAHLFEKNKKKEADRVASQFKKFRTTHTVTEDQKMIGRIEITAKGDEGATGRQKTKKPRSRKKQSIEA